MDRLSALFLISALTLTGVASWGTQSAQAQTFTVVYEFTGEACGVPARGRSHSRQRWQPLWCDDRRPRSRNRLSTEAPAWELGSEPLYRFGVNSPDALGPDARLVFGTR